MRKFKTDVHANYSHPEISEEEEDDAILLDIYHVNRYSDDVQQVFAGISPTEARELAAALNREADAFDEREKARQEARKYPQEDGWYLIGGETFYFAGDWYKGSGSDRGSTYNEAARSRIDKYGYKKMTVED